MENILTAMARQFLPQMEPEERAEALRSLKRMIDEEFFAMAVAESGDETARYMECPRCGSQARAGRPRRAAFPVPPLLEDLHGEDQPRVRDDEA